jgi:hypothetical protein
MDTLVQVFLVLDSLGINLIIISLVNNSYRLRSVEPLSLLNHDALDELLGLQFHLLPDHLAHQLLILT